MDCINILDAKQAIIKLLKDYDRNNRKERCSEVLVKNSNKRFYPTALRVTLSPTRSTTPPKTHVTTKSAAIPIVGDRLG